MAERDDKAIWDLLLVEDRGQNKPALFHHAATLFETKDGDGCTGTLPFDLRRGDRLVLKPRRSNNNGGNGGSGGRGSRR